MAVLIVLGAIGVALLSGIVAAALHHYWAIAGWVSIGLLWVAVLAYRLARPASWDR